MNILVLNAGSSSLKFQIIATDLERIREGKDVRLLRGDVERIGAVHSELWPPICTAPELERLRALSIGELNPTRSAGEPDAIPRFIRLLAATLSLAAAGNG